jgi:predicted nucleic acid-binding protein
MRFWDTSAIVPLIVSERSSLSIDPLLQSDPLIAAWQFSKVEAHSALCRLHRQGSLSAQEKEIASERLRRMVPLWIEVQEGSSIAEIAVTLLDRHPLRAADALQLAAALFLSADLGCSCPSFASITA